MSKTKSKGLKTVQFSTTLAGEKITVNFSKIDDVTYDPKTGMVTFLSGDVEKLFTIDKEVTITILPYDEAHDAEPE